MGFFWWEGRWVCLGLVQHGRRPAPHDTRGGGGVGARFLALSVRPQADLTFAATSSTAAFHTHEAHHSAITSHSPRTTYLRPHRRFCSLTISGGLATRTPTNFSVSFVPCKGKAGHWVGPHCAQCHPAWYGPECLLPCPVAFGAVCGGHGRCDNGPEGAGGCSCDASSAGHWTGDECADCQSGYYGADCALRCPGAGLICAGHGACEDGRNGTGACTCAVGYAGSACDLLCPVAVGVICSGHGVCARDAATGLGACACEPLWTGIACEAETAAGACPASAGGVCSGHGACVAGACACEPDFAGAVCGTCAPGLHGPACEWACAHGTTYGHLCVCAPGFFGANCSDACPGGAARPCTGHGRCLDGADGAGTCVCDYGYGGSACAAQCPGGAAGPCGGHGACDALTGACVCQDTSAGRWAGAACDECRRGYFGESCDVTCPRDAAGQQCGGRGVCTGNGQCVCHRSPDHGYWTGPVCEDCQIGYYGPGCSQQCAGGVCVCARCSQNGGAERRAGCRIVLSPPVPIGGPDFPIRRDALPAPAGEGAALSGQSEYTWSTP